MDHGRRALMSLAPLVVAAALAGCGAAAVQPTSGGDSWRIASTDGRVHEGPYGSRATWRDAAVASAAHDLSCDTRSIAVVSVIAPDQAEGSPIPGLAILEGAAERVTYALVVDGSTRRCVLIARLALSR